MENLHSVLLQMQESLNELEMTLVEELDQLRRVKFNPVSLQIISDSKSQLLSTIGYYDDMRKQVETSMHIFAPYPQNEHFAAHWTAITTKVASANKLNMKVYDLLDSHIRKTDYLKKLFSNAGTISTLYGSEGQSRPPTSGKSYNISV